MFRKLPLLCILYLLLIVASGCAPTSSQLKKQHKKMDSAELIKKINQVDDGLQFNIISILQERREISALEKLLLHEDMWIRKWAIDALGNLKSTQAVPNIINFILDQNNEWVRGHAGVASPREDPLRRVTVVSRSQPLCGGRPCRRLAQRSQQNRKARADPSQQK